MPPRSRAPQPPAAEHPADKAVRTKDAAARPVTAAFAAFAAGRDDEARTLIAAVGLQSPFLDWRVLLRGLMAHAAGDATRALENFARLDPNRLPARLAEPLRITLDPTSTARLAGPAKTLFGDPLAENLLELRKLLGGGRKLNGAFKLLPQVVPQLKVRSPKAERELARVVYHAVRRHGEPDDLAKLKKLFGPYPDDPAFHRLSALAYEETVATGEILRHWLAYEKWLTSCPAGWPPELATRARATVLMRAARFCAEPVESFLSAPPPDPVPLWRRAVELAPGWSPPAADLMMYLIADKKLAEAEAVARAQLAHEPGAVPFLEALARILAKTGRADEALATRQRQLAAGPLDPKIRFHVARAHLSAARAGLIDGDAKRALELTTAGRAFREANLEAAFLGLSAIAKRKLKDKTADADHDAASALPGARLEIAYAAAVDAGLAKLPPAAKTAANKRFLEVLEGGVTVGEIAQALMALDQYAGDGISYRGSKAHATKLLEAATAAASRGGDEREFEKLARVSLVRNDPKVAAKLLPKLRLKFPKNPLLALAEAEAMIAGKSRPGGAKLMKLLTVASQSTDPRHEATAAQAKLLLDELFAFDIGDFFRA